MNLREKIEDENDDKDNSYPDFWRSTEKPENNLPFSHRRRRRARQRRRGRREHVILPAILREVVK